MKTIIYILSISLATVFMSCRDGDSTTGRLTVKMTDAPFPSDLVTQANVTITKIEARQKGGDASEFIVLSEEEASFNLLDLTNGVTATLVDLEVPVGSYDLVRVHIKESSVVLSDNTTFNLSIPSGAQSGLKIFIDPAIMVSGGLTADLLLDFDVSRSYVMQGNLDTPAGIKGFSFKPVIKASNISTSGTLQGAITNADELAVEGAVVTLMIADTVNTTTLTNAEGLYKVMGLTPGVYDVEVESVGYVSQSFEGIEVVAGNATKLDAELSLE